MTKFVKMTPEKAQDISKLIKRLEGLTEPCRECDALIECAIRSGATVAADVLAGHYWQEEGIDETLYRAKDFTKSIDAAVSLIPEGIDEYELYYGTAQPAKYCFVLPDVTDADYWRQVRGDSNINPAIAICIAALKAIMAMQS